MNKDKDDKKALQKVSPQTPQKLGEGSSLAKRGLQDLGVLPSVRELLRQLQENFKKIHYRDPAVLKEYISLCEEVLSTHPYQRLALHYYAVALKLKGEYEKAIEVTSKILSEHSDDFQMYGIRAECYLKLGEYQKALDDYKNEILFDDDLSDEPFDKELSGHIKQKVFSNMAECYSQLGDFAGAHEYIDKAIKEEDEEIEDGKSLVKKAEIFEKQGESLDAMKWYLLAVKKFPYSTYAETKFNDAIERGIIKI